MKGGEGGLKNSLGLPPNVTHSLTHSLARSLNYQIAHSTSPSSLKTFTPSPGGALQFGEDVDVVVLEVSLRRTF